MENGKEDKVDQDLINFISDFEALPKKDEGDPSTEPLVEPPVNEPPKEPPKEPAPPKDESTPPVEPPIEPNPDDDEMTLLKEQNRLLLERLDKLEGQPPIPKEPPVKPNEPKPQVKLDDINFLEGIEGQAYDALFEDPKKFNELLLKVFKKGQEYKTSDVSENVLKNIPKLVVEYQRRHTDMLNIVNDFYTKNADLVKVKKTVGAIMNEVAAEMPDKTVEECLNEAATRTRKILGLREKKSDPVPPAGDPNLPGKTGQKKETVKSKDLKGIAKEINDLLIE